MDMGEWARNEVELACKREAPDRKDGEWDYGCACYESALKALNSLMDDGHSGMSFSFTVGILERLMERKPLTPIEDTPDVWNDASYSNDGNRDYQCKRMSSLFKHVSADGNVTYSDVGRYYCVNPDDKISFTCGIYGRLIDELRPITMPYYPPLGQYVLTVQEFLTDKKNGDFDTAAVLTMKTPEGTVENICRYFGEYDGRWKEIDVAEFYRRRVMADYLKEGDTAETD